MSEKFVFTCSDLEKYYGQKKVLDGINLSFYLGAKIGIVGDNGSGKSTLLRIMAGEDKEVEGQAEPLKGMKVGFVPQEPRLNPGLTVHENLKLAFGKTTALLDRFEAISTCLEDPELGPDKMQDLMDEMSDVQDKIDAVDGWELERQIETAANALCLPDDNVDVSTLSGGEARRVYLAKVLLEKPDLLLLDEPTNHLDAETISWLENHLREYAGTVIIVTHDRYFLDNITKWILELRDGKGIPFEGSYSQWLEARAERLSREGQKADSHRKILNRELEWLKSSPKGRRTRNKARVNDYSKMMERSFDVDENSLEIQIPPGQRLGNQVIPAKNISKRFGDRTLFEGLSFDIPPGGIVGIIGPNGVGKTTLFRMIMGEEQPDDGSLTVGSTVELSYVDQARDHLNDSSTIYDEISGGAEWLDLGGKRMNSRAYVSRFNFRSQDQQKKVGNLSGGERNRVHLAKLLRRGGNVLLLDEPTNDLDTHTLRVLEEGLLNFPSCALVISHDRFFLDRICTHLLAFEGESKVSWFEGGFREYEESRQAAGLDPIGNRRARYRKLHLN